MVSNEVLAAWMVAATTAAAALGGLSLLDSRTSPSGVEVEPLPLYYASMTTAWRPLPPDGTWRDRLEITGSLPGRPAAILADLSDDEMDLRPMRDEAAEGPLATAYGSGGLMGP